MTFSRSNALRVAALLLRIALGAVFVYAAWLKLRDPWQMFAMSIDSYQLLPMWAVRVVARTLPWVELLLGMLLIAGLGAHLRHGGFAHAAGVFQPDRAGLGEAHGDQLRLLRAGDTSPGRPAARRLAAGRGLFVTAMSLIRPRKAADAGPRAEVFGASWST